MCLVCLIDSPPSAEFLGTRENAATLSVSASLFIPQTYVNMPGNVNQNGRLWHKKCVKERSDMAGPKTAGRGLEMPPRSQFLLHSRAHFSPPSKPQICKFFVCQFSIFGGGSCEPLTAKMVQGFNARISSGKPPIRWERVGVRVRPPKRRKKAGPAQPIHSRPSGGPVMVIP